ncbi:tetratricopeptide repeat protein [Fructilactobacillus sanfranciscensis]|uniref:tetratricopeptide repeat protein n=1 Tax=Fructilactobacillus sanfranciscensis TaxID=1625 RepID=UPI0031F98524
MSNSEKALEALQNNDLDEYQKNLKNALDQDNDDMLFSLAEELYSLGFSDDALKIYRQLLKKYPDEDEIRTYIADILIAKDDTDGALEVLNEIKPDSSYYINALLVEADLYQTQDLFVVSEHKLIEAEKLAPDEPIVKFAVAELYYSEGKYESAIKLYLNLIKQGQLSISNVNLVERLGVSYAHVGNFENAIGYLEQIKPIDMTPDVLFETGFTYLQLGNYAKSIEIFEMLRDTDNQYASLYIYLGEAFEKDNKPEDALRTYQEGLSVDEYNVILYLKAADIAARLGKMDLTVKYLEKGNQVNPDNMEAVTKLSEIYVKDGQFEKDVDFLSDYLSDNNLVPQLYWDLAISYDHMNKIKQASENYQKAAMNLKDNPDFLKNYIFFLRENGKVNESIEFLKQYVNLVPDDDEMVYMLQDLETK